MRLLVVANGYPPRGRFGTEFYTRELVRGLLQRGHELAVLHPERGGGRPRYTLERVEEQGVPVFLLHNPGDPRKRFRASYRDERVEQVFAELLARERPELVHFTYLLWGLSLRLPEIARAQGIPSVLTLTDYGLLCHRGQMFDATLERCGGPHPAARCARCIRTPSASDHAPLVRLARSAAAEGLALLGGLGRVPVAAELEEREREVRRAWAVPARLLAPTQALLETFVRAGVPRARLVPLLYAFDEEPYRAAATPPAVPRFGFVGQLAPHKGLACLLAAARELAALEPARPWELVLHGQLGAGRHARYAQRLVAGMDHQRVRLAPPFGPEQAPALFRGLSALVSPSEWDENAPLAVLQARAAGVPVIATDVPGISEIVRTPSQGRLVAVGDAAGLARAMLAVLRGELAAPCEPGLPLSLSAHLTRLEELYGAVRAGRPEGVRG